MRKKDTVEKRISNQFLTKKDLFPKEIYTVVVRLPVERCTFKPQIVNWMNELQVG